MIYGNNFNVVLTQYPGVWWNISYMFTLLHYEHHTCRVINHILDMVISKQFYCCHVKLPKKDRTPPEICCNPKLYPFLCDCRGAVDGTHVDAFVSNDAVSHYQNQKGGLTQNVVAACTFDSGSVLSWVDGREVQHMCKFGMMHSGMILQSPQERTILLLQAFWHAVLSLFHTVGRDTISKSGAMPHKSECK